MIVSFILGIGIIAVVLWIYLKFAPSGTTFKSRLGYELAVLMAEIAGCVGVSYLSYATVGHGPESAWWPVLAVIYSFMLIPCVLILSIILRWWIYRDKPEEG